MIEQGADDRAGGRRQSRGTRAEQGDDDRAWGVMTEVKPTLSHFIEKLHCGLLKRIQVHTETRGNFKINTGFMLNKGRKVRSPKSALGYTKQRPRMVKSGQVRSSQLYYPIQRNDIAVF